MCRISFSRALEAPGDFCRARNWVVWGLTCRVSNLHLLTWQESHTSQLAMFQCQRNRTQGKSSSGLSCRFQFFRHLQLEYEGSLDCSQYAHGIQNAGNKLANLHSLKRASSVVFRCGCRANRVVWKSCFDRKCGAKHQTEFCVRKCRYKPFHRKLERKFAL